MKHSVDVAIIGGGPAGSTTATLLRKHNPRLSVSVFEREKFPRDHVGESLLPIINKVLWEMEVWDKIEAANFPVKIGATYRWGSTDNLWNFEFIPDGKFEEMPRPGKFLGQRHKTAFQVDRAVYDKILLDQARFAGAKVFEETRVLEVKTAGDRVEGLRLENGDEVTARWYIDCSGHSGILRRALKVPVTVPTKLQNIAIWSYWQNAEWASTVGYAGTRILVMSLGYGWIWFIPVSPTRTSIGLVLPVEYYKASGQDTETLYNKALAEEPKIAELIKNATSEGKILTTNDWSYISDRLAGENWFLVGESAGFADPILSAGMTLAHTGGRECAYTILSEDKKEFEPGWASKHYSDQQIRKINQHIRFADFWYTSNKHFSDLKEFTREIAADAGLDLDAEAAWQWIGTGGFVDDESGGGGVAAYNLIAAHHVTEAFTGGRVDWVSSGKSRFELNLDGSEKAWTASYENGKISRSRCYVRGGKRLPTKEPFSWIISALKENPTYEGIYRYVTRMTKSQGMPQEVFYDNMGLVHGALEAMTQDGWVIASEDPNFTPVPVSNMEPFIV